MAETDLQADRTVSTGAGPTPGEIGAAVVNALKSAGPGEMPENELWPAYWDLERVESIEADGSAFVGEAGLRRKAEWWDGQFEVARMEVEGPFVGGTGFALRFEIDAKHRESGEVKSMVEIGVYTVENGKIVREEFMYGGE